jgi:hypothetical protein
VNSTKQVPGLASVTLQVTKALAATLALAVVLSAPLDAQMPGRQTSNRFDTGIVVGGDWLQANALPLDREVMPSAQFGVSWRRQSWAVDGGFLRVARSLSTVQGGYLSAGPLLHWNRVLFLPTVAGFAGQSYASRDSSGYNWVDPQGIPGHQPRYSYSSGFSAGGSVGLAIEVPVYRMIGVHASASEWFFSGAPLAGDRDRTLIGVGLSLRLVR